MSYTPNQILPKTGFGELNVAENRPFIQATAAYNVIPSNFREFTTGSGTTSAADKLFQVSTGTDSGGYGAIQSFRALNYKAGEAGLARFTALFESNVASSWQGVGLVNLGDELSFGYNGTSFGIWHRYGGLAECRTIDITSAATGNETVSATLNDVLYEIPVTSGTVEHNAYEIASWLNNNQTVWGADQLDDSVIVSALSDGAKNNTYTITSDGSFAGTVTARTSGITKTSDFIAEADWNGQQISNLDPTKGNVYQITYQYLGFGDIKFYVEDSNTGDFVLVHTLKYANNNTTTSLTNPSLRLGMYAVSLGSTTNLVVKSGSMAAFVQGREGITRNPRGIKNTQNITTTFENIITIRNRRTYNYLVNQVEIEPLELTVSSESSKNVEVEIRSTSNTNVEQNFTNTGTNLVTDYDTSSVYVSSGRLLAAFTINAGGEAAVNLKDFRIRIPPTLNFVVQARTTGGAAADVSAGLVWYEDA